MAEDKKPKSKLTFENTVFILFALALVSTALNRLAVFLQTDPTLRQINEDSLYNVFVNSFLPKFTLVSFFISAASFVGIVYAYRKLSEIIMEQKKVYYPTGVSEAPSEREVNRRWERVIAHVESPNVSDWKLAILEADIMLDELLDACGYHGDSIGEKLKQVEKSDFTTIELAWEAHKVRNAIAHEGADFLITEREARRIIDLYRQVFEEFDMI